MRNQGYVVLQKDFVLKKVDIFIFFEILYIFFVFFKLLENMCHTTQTVRQTLKEKEKYF